MGCVLNLLQRMNRVTLLGRCLLNGTLNIMQQFYKQVFISLYVWIWETRVPSRAAALGIIIIILWVNIFYTASMSIIKCIIGFSVGYLLVRTSKSLTPCAGCYAFSICRGAVIGLDGLNSVKKLRGNDPCHSDIGTAPRRQNVCWRGAWIILEFSRSNSKRFTLFLY